MKRSALKRKSRLRPVSKKQSGRLREYKTARAVYLSEHLDCEVCGQRRATEVHHKRQRGIHLTDTTTFLAVCGGPEGCHARIHGSPSWARDRGYLI